MGATSTNPWLISVINMVIVFGVLAVLWFVMKILYLVDPTKNKVAEKKNKNQEITSSPDSYQIKYYVQKYIFLFK